MRFFLVLNIFLALTYCKNVFAQADFIASETEGCTPFKVKFSIDLSTVDIDTIDNMAWDFGNGTTSDLTDPDTVTYLEDGLYTVRMTINGDTIARSGFIRVHRTVSAQFEVRKLDEKLTYTFVPIDRITDPAGVYTYLWRFYHGSNVIKSVPYNGININNRDNVRETTIFPDTGNYTIILDVSDNYGCISDYSLDFLVTTEFEIGNVYSPNSSEYFIIDPNNPAVILSFKIYTRTGVKVFQQDAPRIYWDGRNNSGQDLGSGVYYYVLEALEGDPDGYYSKLGFIHLFR